MGKNLTSDRFRILIVDGNPISQTFICRILCELDVILHMTDTGTEAIEQSLLYDYSMIICDLQMPDIDGFEFLNRLNENSTMQTIPVIVMTSGIISDQLFTEVIASGGYDIIQKTKSAEVLKAKFNAIIRLIKSRTKNLSALRPTIEHGKLKPEKANSVIRNYTNASVFFADFVDFTGISKKSDIEAVVRKLANYFDQFDEISRDLNIEKIKTIGDCYMAVAGMPTQNKYSAFEVLLAALRIRKYVKTIADEEAANGNQKWHIKIGIATGFITSGILKSNNYKYDVWGNSVNLASRIEGQAIKDEILVCEQTYLRTHSLFEFELYGIINLRGFGNASLYRLIGIRSDYADFGDRAIPNQHFYDNLYRESQEYLEPSD